MKTDNYSRVDKACKFCAKYTFIMGSMILLLYCVTGISEVRVAGFVYFVAAILINLLMVFILFVHLLVYPKQYFDLLKSAAIILVNLPIAIFYLWLVEEVQDKIFHITNKL